MARLTEYDEQQVAHGVAVLESVGGNMKKAAKLLGIPRTTLRGWVGKNSMSQTAVNRTPNAEVVRDERKSLAAKWENALVQALDHAALEEVIAKATYRDLLIGAGIATEKVELLNGRATGRNESIQIHLVAGGSLNELAEVALNRTNALGDGSELDSD